MADQVHRSWLMRKFESAIQRGFMRAYHQVRVDPARFLMQLRSAHRLPISGYEGVFQLGSPTTWWRVVSRLMVAWRLDMSREDVSA